jgi:hypothetical protein
MNGLESVELCGLCQKTTIGSPQLIDDAVQLIDLLFQDSHSSQLPELLIVALSWI